jgi:hypothetical protein
MSIVLNKSKRKRITIDYSVPTVEQPQTGVWLSRPTIAGESYGGDPNPDYARASAGSIAVPSGIGGGVIKLTWMYPLASWEFYPQILFTGFQDIPATPGSPSQSLTTTVEWVEFRSHFSLHQSTTTPTVSPPYALSAVFQINVQPGLALNQGGGISGFYGLYEDGTERSNYLLASNDRSDGFSANRVSFGFHDDTGTTIDPATLTFPTRYKLTGSGTGGPFPDDPCVATITDTSIALYCDAIRVNCGSLVPLSLLQERYPDGYYTFAADNNVNFVVGGTTQVLHTPETTLYHSRRHGTSFSYTCGPGLFSDYYDHTAYLVMLYFIDPVSSGAGQNVFTVSLNDVVVGSLDIFALAGGANLPYTVEYPVTVSGKQPLVIQFTAATGEAMCSGIRVAPVVYADPADVAQIPVPNISAPFKIYADGSRMEWMACGSDQRSTYQQAGISSPMHPSIGGGE